MHYFCPHHDALNLQIAQCHDFCYRYSYQIINEKDESLQETLDLRECESMLFNFSHHYRISDEMKCGQTDGGLPEFSSWKRLPPSPYLAKVLTQYGSPQNRMILKHQFVSDLGYHAVDLFCAAMSKTFSDTLALNLINIADHDHENEEVSERILCVLYTTEERHLHAVTTVVDTWGAKCDGFIAFSTVEDMTIPTVSVPHGGEESYDNMWQKIVSIVKYIYEHYRTQFDWYYFAGDDAYLIVENLKSFLRTDEPIQSSRSSGKGIYIGQQIYLDACSIFESDKRNGGKYTFNTGGAGYVLDSVSLETVAKGLTPPSYNFTKSFDNSSEWSDPCKSTVKTSAEDVYMANCLRKFGIMPMETRDEGNRERFHHFSPGTAWNYNPPGGVSNDWWASHMLNFQNGSQCCSPSSISFHYLQPNHMKAVDAYLYLCRP